MQSNSTKNPTNSTKSPFGLLLKQKLSYAVNISYIYSLQF